MMDETIPLTTGEWDEWGNPKEKEFHDYMLSYSPYDQVEAKDYPHLLVTTSLNDSHVQYYEPAKWVAKLRALKTDDKRLIFKTEMHGSHDGIVTLIVLGRKGPHWIPFQAAALALSHTLNASFRNRLNVSLLHK